MIVRAISIAANPSTAKPSSHRIGAAAAQARRLAEPDCVVVTCSSMPHDVRYARLAAVAVSRTGQRATP